MNTTIKVLSSEDIQAVTGGVTPFVAGAIWGARTVVKIYAIYKASEAL